jgi:HlyD family secretion protein
MSGRGVRLLVFVVCAAGVVYLAGCGKKDPPAPAAAPANGVSANGADPAADGRHIDAFGIVTPRTVHAVFLEFPAMLERKRVSEGQRVRRGDVLFTFSRGDYDAQVESKRYELTLARLELKTAGIDVKNLQEDLQAARDDVDMARKDLDDREKMLSLGVESRSGVEEAERTLKARQQKVRQLAMSLEEYDGGDVNSQEAQTARIAILEGELERLREQTDRPFIVEETIVCDVREGVVSEIGYDEGDSVSKGKKLCNLIDLDSIVVEAGIPEEFIKDVRIGSAATVVPVADNSRSYEGKVTRISNLAVKNNGETVVAVEITLTDKDGFLLPNFNVDVSIR